MDHSAPDTHDLALALARWLEAAQAAGTPGARTTALEEARRHLAAYTCRPEPSRRTRPAGRSPEASSR